jgi:hypothetical protein
LREGCKLRVFENRLLKKILGPKRDEVTGEWRRLHKKQLHAQSCSPDIIRVIKSRRLKWAGHIALMGESSRACRVLMGKPEGINHLEDPGVDGKIILKWILEKSDGGIDWIDLVRNRDTWQAVVTEKMNLHFP